MIKGELLTRLSIWLSLGGYAFTAIALLIRPKDERWLRRARMAWTIGCAAMVVHLVFAFHFYHGWSQESALRATARQTAEVTGIFWSGGLYINYLLLTAWVSDVAVWWWLGIDGYRSRSRFITFLWHAVFIFIVFNATVVFKTGPLRWIGLVFTLLLASLWIRRAAAPGNLAPSR